MFGSIMQVNMMINGIVFLLFGMKSVLVSSANTANNISKSINYQVEYPCNRENSFAKENCTGTSPSYYDVKTYLRYVNVLKNNIQGLERAYNETHYNICQDTVKMNATMDYMVKQKFCEIPSTMVDYDMSHSSPNMRQLTKWMIWLAEAEKKVGSIDELGYKFFSVAAYAKKTACHQERKLCIQESDVNDVINCTLPAIEENADPQDLIPISCHVLNHIHNYTKILKRSVRKQIKQAKKNKKCKKGGRKGRNSRKNMKNRKNRKPRCKKTRRNSKGGKRRNMTKRKNGTRRGCRKCKNNSN